MKLTASLSAICLGLVCSTQAAQSWRKPVLLNYPGVQACTLYTDGDRFNWKYVTSIMSVRPWYKAYLEYVQHATPILNQDVRFAVELARDGYPNTLYLENKAPQGNQHKAYYKYNVFLNGDQVRSYWLKSGEDCVVKGTKVDFQTANVKYITVDIKQ